MRAGWQQGSTSQPQAGAGAASQQGAGAGAGAAQQGAGAGAASQPQEGAGSQQLCFLAWSFAIKALKWCLRAGVQQGSTSQPQLGAGAASQQETGAGSQHDGAASQQECLWKRPAEAVDEKLTATTATAKEAIKRRMDVSPNTNKGFIYRVPKSSGEWPSWPQPVTRLNDGE